MKLNFCTLFNSAYLTRGLVLYHSLLENCSDFHLYVFAFDDVCYDYLIAQNFDKLTVVSLKEFEDEELLRIKPTRTAGEYCWTSTASTILFSINTFKLDNCTYIDADMCFYSDPRVLVDEMGSNSVLITEHRYSPQYDQSENSGKYCVQFVTFKNTPEGMAVLNDWRNSCIDWCFNRVEDGKFGDQKYLDGWTTKFQWVHELKHLGGGVAPWNIQQYHFYKKNGKVFGREIKTSREFQLVFFHYHSLKIHEEDIVSLCDALYDLKKEDISVLYSEYVGKLLKEFKKVKAKNLNINANGIFSKAPYKPLSISTILDYYKENIKASRRNILGFNLLKRIRNHYYFSVKDFAQGD